jgi:signal transduction histidine kinase
VIRSLVARLTLVEQITAAAAVTAFGLSALWITGHELRSERQAYVTATARRLAKDLDDELAEAPDTLAAARSVLDEGLESGVRVEILDSSGRSLTSRLASAGRRSTRGVPPARASQEPFAATCRSQSGELISVTATDAPVRSTMSALRDSLLIAALPILAIGMFVARWLAVRAVRPLSILAGRAAGLAVERNPLTLGARSGLHEIDRLAEAFDQLLDRLDRALRAERRLTADVSHELRTPLTVLSGELELALQSAAPGGPAADGLRRIAEQVSSMRELVEAVLLLHGSGEAAPGSHGAYEVVNLCDLARETVTGARARIPGRASDVALVAPDEILVLAHPTLMDSALRNLLDNAIKFTRAGQKVIVEVAESAGEARLTVDDAGPGIPALERERIFDPFYRGAEARAGAPGHGLGLPILSRVARAHGGEVQAADSPLGGARFVLRLPKFAGLPGDP